MADAVRGGLVRLTGLIPHDGIADAVFVVAVILTDHVDRLIGVTK